MKPIIRLACLAVAATILGPPTPIAAQRPFDEIIVFGHSGSDPGNAFRLSGEVVAAPPYFGGRFSNGPLWIEWLANRLGFQHPTEKNFYPSPSLAGGTCYAYGGAETGSGFSDACLGVGPNKVCAPNVGLQIEMFFADGRTLDGDELIVVRAGGNDASPVIAARNMGDHIATLAAAGGKVFLVPGERRFSQDPGGIEADPSMNTFVAIFNAALAEELDAVEAMFDITIIRFDLLGLNDRIIAEPAVFGLTNVTEPACPDCGFGIPAPGAEATIVPNPDEYLYWDDFHFTAVVQKIIGDAAADYVLAARQ